MHAVIPLVREAGEAILPFWRNNTQVIEKADASPVTEADYAAHRVLAEGLKRIAPDIPVLSEEDCDIPLGERSAWTRWWLVDPLDGTKEFIAGTDEFTVNVALIEAGRVVFGVVGIPVSGQCFFGGDGMGAWRQDTPDAPASAIQVRQQPVDAFEVVASRRHGSEAQARLLEGLSAEVGGLSRVNVGSSLKFCLLAEGRADCYPRLAPTSQWDTAAAQGVLEGAGGEILETHGTPLRYDMREDFLNPDFLALPKGVAWRDALVALAREAVANR
ncbi:3'(2'),5'-bisphosphate nucleotidase CysQ [Pseudomonas sp. Marseille-QA0892]